MIFTIGVDVGQRNTSEYTAIALVERWVNVADLGWVSYWQNETARALWDFYDPTFDWGGSKYPHRAADQRAPHAALRYLNRFSIQQSYLELSRHINELRMHLPPEAPVEIVFHEGSVGRETVRLIMSDIKKVPAFSIVITDGTAVSRPLADRFFVPRGTLLHGLNALFDAAPPRLHLDPGAVTRYGRQLESALHATPLRTPTGNDVIVGREREADDLVFATAIACWRNLRPLRRKARSRAY